MRHLLANLAAYVIAALIVLGAASFAWVRSNQWVVSDEETLFTGYGPVEMRDFDWEPIGADGYVRNCASCHGADGAGWDQYPGVGHTAALLAAAGGRDYVVDLHLYGLSSPRWRVPMPPMGHMTDVELAAVLNHLLVHHDEAGALPSDTRLYLPADIAARRGRELQPAEVNDGRPALEAAVSRP